MFGALKKMLVHFTQAGSDVQPTGTLRPFDLVVKFTDGQDDDIRSFETAEAREDHVQKLVNSKASATVASIDYERAVVFWRSGDSSALPEVVPTLDGEGELVLRIFGTKNSMVEAVGYSMRTISGLFTKQAGGELGSPRSALVARRIAVYKRCSILVRADSIPVSASRDY